MVQGSQGFVEDPRNDRVLLYVNGDMVPRRDATVSVFDAGFVLGDGVWEGFRLVRGKVAFLDRHLDRLYEGAAAIDLDIGMDRMALAGALYRTVTANDMQDGVHIRLMVTRGLKRTPNQDPRYTVGAATVVIVAEWKEPNPEVKKKGLRLFTSTIRTTPPDMFDMRINSHSRLPLITALIQALKAGADEALMLDPHGFVASCNATNFFIVRRGEVWTSTGRFSFNGITRANVIALAEANGIPMLQKDFTLAEVATADEAFVTGTFGGVTPVSAVDGRVIGGGPGGPVTQRLDALYRDLLAAEGA
ncbi:aminotransferase class IV [Stella sp.]|uniref:aminotransferase class IV n=1 Tax=Stella sp. TaxID=2912054 RepID=UPI0035B05544